MVHLWVRAESRQNERRVGLTPEGAASLLRQGIDVTIEDSQSRVIPTSDYADVGCAIAPEGTWMNAPQDAIIFGLKELPTTRDALKHRHILFGHAFKGQAAGVKLLGRFRAGGGKLLDLEYLLDAAGRRVAAFGYWAGYAGAAISLRAWAGECSPVSVYPSSTSMSDEVRQLLNGRRPTVLIIGALGRVGTGATNFCEGLGLTVTKWDISETQHGGPFPEILEHDVFLNCILANEGVPVFVPESTKNANRSLCVIGDIACDPDSAFNPIKVYDAVTSWEAPVTRVAADPALDVMAIDNLPSLLPRESSEDFAAQLLPYLRDLEKDESGVWHRAESIFRSHL